MAKEVPRRDVDGGWAWVVLVGSFVTSAIVFGFIFNGGIYFVTFLEVFGQSRSYTSLVFAMQTLTVHLGGAVSSILLSRFGPRATMMTGSILAASCMTTAFFAQSIPMLAALFGLAGLGSVLAMTSSLSAISVYFDEHFSVVTGLTNSGAGVGMSGMGAVIEWTMEAFGWRGSMLILAGVLSQCTLCGALIFHSPNKGLDGPRGPRARQHAILRTVWKDPRWHTLFLNMLFYFFAWNVTLLILKDSFVAKGLPGISYRSAIVCFGVANTLGRLSSGFLSRYLLDPPLQNFVTSVLTGAAVLGVMAADDLWTYAACVVILAFALGQLAVLQALSIAYIYGNDAMPVLWGYGVVSGTFSLGGATLTGYLVDVSGSYTSVYVFCSLCVSVSGLFSLICYFIHRRKLRLTSDAHETGRKDDGEIRPLTDLNAPDEKHVKPKCTQREDRPV